MNFFNCVIYLSLTSFLGFIVGRFLARYPLNADAFPYRSFKFEKDGLIYEKIKIKSWQSKVPDMSRIVPSLVPSKNMEGHLDAKKLEIMLRETCVAELTHYLLCLSGMYGCFHFLHGKAASIVYLLYLLMNVPCMVIQRYNRPRLKRVLAGFARHDELLHAAHQSTASIYSSANDAELSEIETSRHSI